MVQLEIVNNNLIVTAKGISKFLSLKNRMVIPLEHIRGITADPGIFHSDRLKGLRAPGTDLPGFRAGTFHTKEGKIFWNVHNPNNAVVIELQDEPYVRLIVEVVNPENAVQLVESSLI